VDGERRIPGCLFSFVQSVQLQLWLNQKVFLSCIQCGLWKVGRLASVDVMVDLLKKNACLYCYNGLDACLVTAVSPPQRGSLNYVVLPCARKILMSILLKLPQSV